MTENCKKSCGQCGDGPTPPGPTPGPTGDSVDWRDKGAVNAVQNQASCGSCWAFSACTTLESEHFIKTGNLLKFSEQQLVDCAGSYGNYGCNGGFQAGAFNYAAANYLMSETSYPYKGVDQSCRYNSGSTTGVKATSNKQVSPAKQIAAMKTAISAQPVSVLVEADRSSFQSYTSGIMNSTSCGTNLDHATAVVGYGTDSSSGQDYWIMRNSWGSWWGDNGYMKIATKEGNGYCGVQMSVYTVTTN
jgi:C1A family cysteine protease